MSFDPSRFPSVVAYLEQLPSGIESHPQCTVKRDILENSIELLRQHLSVAEAPEPLRPLLEGLKDPWIPDVLANVAWLAIRDVCFDSREAYLAEVRNWSTQLYRKPTYRALMFVLSPNLMVMGAAKRWGAFRRGSTLEVSKVRKEEGRFVVEGKTTFPEHLYDELIMDSINLSSVTALEAASAKNVRMDRVEFGPTISRTVTSWDA